MARPSVKEFQEGIGQTGRLGEIFVGLGAFIFVYGLGLWYLAYTPIIEQSPVGGLRAQHDLFPVWFFYLVMGVGFSVFGAMAILSGWARHHPDSEW